MEEYDGEFRVVIDVGSEETRAGLAQELITRFKTIVGYLKNKLDIILFKHSNCFTF